MNIPGMIHERFRANRPYKRWSIPQFYARKNDSDRRYMVLSMNPEATGKLQSMIRNYITTRGINDHQRSVAQGMLDELERAADAYRKGSRNAYSKAKTHAL